MKQKRYLTKSRFKLATECPTKLFYTGKDEFPNTTLDDPFLSALADGGFQVGELAKSYYPNGISIESVDIESAEKETLALLQQTNVIIFEPVIRFESLLARIDILVKQGNEYQLIEVKAKSYSQKKDGDFLNKSGNIISGWKPYILDVAFQQLVLKKSIKNAVISSYLMLADKDTECATDGLNQKFLLKRDDKNRCGVEVSNTLIPSDLKHKLLRKVNVEQAVNVAYAKELTQGMTENSFEKNVFSLADYYQRDERIAPVIGVYCKKCEFVCSREQESNGFKSGFKTCWKEQLRWSDKDFDDSTVLDVSNFRKAKACIDNGLIKLTDITKDDINYEDSSSPQLSLKERQWLQIEKVQNQDVTAYFDSDSIKNEMKKWKYPLHFIDFETSAVAIPFHKGMRPYEGIAFQFSHHTVDERGDIKHAGQFLHTAQGEFPNFEFVRELKLQLENDEGTIFRYSNHENTYLNMIYRQLQDSHEIDKNQLSDFIKTITISTQKSTESWLGGRCMVDQWELVKNYYYDPATKGSNSIKAVLPAILNSSKYLKEKYSKAVYGTNKIPSLNMNNKSWVSFDVDNKVEDPYKHLPKMFSDLSEHNVELLSETDELNNGGLALTAYAKMQFSEMTPYERDELEKALLLYCELDTFAMVMIYEAWREMLK